MSIELMELLEPEEIVRFTKQELKEAVNLGREQMLSIHGFYVNAQKQRVGLRNRESAHQRKSDILLDPFLITALKNNMKQVEDKAKQIMTVFVKSNPLGLWAIQIAGCDSVIASGLLAHIDLNRAITAGAVWKFADVIPRKREDWQPGQRRPFNARLKTICWNLSSCFKRLSAFDKTEEQIIEEVRKKNPKITDEELFAEVHRKQMMSAKRKGNLDKPEYMYVNIYMKRKMQEIERNEKGLLAEQAYEKLEYARKKRIPIPDNMRKTWESGKLQPCGLDLRAMKYTAKIFLSAYWEVGRKIYGLPIVKPWPLEHGGHVHYIPPPCADDLDGLIAKAEAFKQKCLN